MITPMFEYGAQGLPTSTRIVATVPAAWVLSNLGDPREHGNIYFVAKSNDYNIIILHVIVTRLSPPQLLSRQIEYRR